MNKFENFLGLTKRAGHLIEGYSRCNEQRNKINLHLIIISDDASESTRKKFKKHSIAKDILLIEDFAKEELGEAIGREEIKILAIKDKKMAERLFELYQEEKEKI